MDLEEFVDKIANNLSIAKVLSFFYQNQNTIDNENGLSIWLNIEKKRLKEILDVLVKYEVLNFEFSMYLYSPNSHMKNVVKEFIIYYENNNKEFVDKISNIDFKERELERKLEEMTTMLFEKNRVLFIIQEINDVINSTENLAKILEKLWKLIMKHIETDVILIEYKLQNIKGFRVITEFEILKEELIGFFKDKKESNCTSEKKLIKCKNMALYNFDLIGEKDEKIGTFILGRDYDKKEGFEKDHELAMVIASLLTQMLEKQNYFFEKLKKEKLESDLELAKKIQLSYVPTEFPEIDKYEFASLYKAAKLVGGDYYDWFKLDEKTYAFVMGDVSGKGSSAALFMVKARENFRIFSKRYSDPKLVLENVNDSLANDVDVEKFMTVFYGILDTEKNVLTFSNAGHDPMILIKENELLEYKLKGIPLGIMEKVSYQKGEIQIKEGETIVLYTDGVVEARNDKKDFYGFERFKILLKKNREKTAKEIVEEVYNDVEKFNGFLSQHDDFTLLVIKYR